MVSGGFYVDLHDGGGYQVLPRSHKWTLRGYVDIANNRRRGRDDCWTGDFLSVCPFRDTPEVSHVIPKRVSDPTPLTDIAGESQVLRGH